MSFFNESDPLTGARDILKLNRPAGRALVEYHVATLRQPSDFTPDQRELIAAYVSALNACQYCAGVHTVTAEAFGIPAGTVAALVDNIDTAPIDDKIRPILRYARKLTLEPAKMVQADADAVFAAGWTEQALHDAVNTICLFNFMNRLLEGHGVKGSTEVYADRGKALMSDGYAPLLKILEGE